jgi:hypothetical protein
MNLSRTDFAFRVSQLEKRHQSRGTVALGQWRIPRSFLPSCATHLWSRSIVAKSSQNHQCDASNVPTTNVRCKDDATMSDLSPPSHNPPIKPASLSTDDSSRKLTPSTRSSLSSDGLPGVNDPNTFELRTLNLPNAPEDAEDVDLRAPNARRASMDSVQSFELYTPDEDRAVLKKLDRKLVAFMALLYSLSFLDRSSELIQHILTSARVLG